MCSPCSGASSPAPKTCVPRGADVAVLAFAFWQSAFGGRDVRGETAAGRQCPRHHHRRCTAILRWRERCEPAGVYIPVTTYAGSTGTDDSKTYYSRYQWGWVNVMVRRKSGVSRQRAEADATQAFRGHGNRRAPIIRRSLLRTMRSRGSRCRPFVAGAGPNPSLEARTALWLVIVAGIVAADCLRQLSRTCSSRERFSAGRETAVRRALGVSRWRLATLPLTESLMLALARWRCGVAGRAVGQRRARQDAGVGG